MVEREVWELLWASLVSKFTKMQKWLIIPITICWALANWMAWPNCCPWNLKLQISLHLVSLDVKTFILKPRKCKFSNTLMIAKFCLARKPFTMSCISERETMRKVYECASSCSQTYHKCSECWGSFVVFHILTNFFSLFCELDVWISLRLNFSLLKLPGYMPECTWL
jgi:hypothetical protein